MHPPRSLEEVLEEQARRWRLVAHVPPRPETRLPVIAVSRQHGAGGREVARQAARALKLELYDREILSRIAEEARCSMRLVSPLDERHDRAWLSDWLLSLMSEGHLSAHQYGYYLSRVLCGIARVGGAVILGRGAQFLLRPEQALRVLVVAPLEVRVANVAARQGLLPAAARQRVLEVDAEREAYLRHHCHGATADPSTVDLALNTERLGVNGAVAAVLAAARVRFPVRESSLRASA